MTPQDRILALNETQYREGAYRAALLELADLGIIRHKNGQPNYGATLAYVRRRAREGLGDEYLREAKRR